MINRFAIILLLLCCLILLVIMALSPFALSWPMATFLAEAYFVAAAASFLAMILDDRKGGVSYMFEFFMLFFIAAPAAWQIHTRLFPWFADLQPQYISIAYGLIAASHASFHVGWLFSSRRPRKNHIENADVKTPADFRFYTKWAWSFAILSILIAAAAGPSNLFVARFERTTANFQGMTWQFLFMCRSLSLLAMVMLLFLVRDQKDGGLRRQNICAVILFIPAFLVINYLPALPRFILFGLLLALSTAFLNYFQLRTKAFVALASIFILFVVFPVIKSLGTGEVNWSGFAARMNFDLIGVYLLRVDFDGFMQIVSTVEYLMRDIGSIRYGENFLGVVLFFVPRAIWPAKPIDTGDIVSTNLGFSYTNVSSPLPAESLMAFGYIGPFIVFFFFALFISKMEERAKIRSGVTPHLPALFLYAISMGFMVIVMRGALNGVAPQFATAFLAFFAMQYAKNHTVVFRRRSAA